MKALKFLEYLLRPKGSTLMAAWELFFIGLGFAMFAIYVNRGDWILATLWGLIIWVNWVQQQRRAFYGGLEKGSEDMAAFAKERFDDLLGILKEIKPPRSLSAQELDERMAPKGIAH